VPPPVSIPDHELVCAIGQGSYGEVWLARNVLGEFRAAKIIYRSRFADPRPFDREFEGIQRFEPISRSHPSQLAILHVGRNDPAGCFYYVMELADVVLGPKFETQTSSESPKPANESAYARAEIRRVYTPHTLRYDLEQRGRLPIPDCLQIGLSLTTALVHLHACGLVHRDIKPSNVVFVKGVPKLGDIGLVTAAGDTQSIVGTEGYIPPEGTGTTQSDIFSLGKVLYEIITGMDRRSFPELPQDLRSWPERNAVAELNAVLLKACAKDSAQRHRSAVELQADLELLQRGGSAKRRRRWQRMMYGAKRYGLAATVLGIASLTIYELAARKPGLAAMEWSDNAEANEAYRMGITVFHENAEGSFERSAKYFQRAVDLDPKFPRANARLARSIIWNGPDDAHNLAKARPFAYKALALNPESDEANCAVGSIKTLLEHDWAGAEKCHLKAISLNPAEDNLYAYASFLTIVGRVKEATEHVERASKLDSRSFVWMQNAAFVYLAARQYDRAVRMIEDIIAEQPTQTHKDALTRGFLVPAYLGSGNYSKAIQLAEEVDLHQPDNANTIKAHYRSLLKAYEEDGAPGYWRRLLEDAKDTKETDPVALAILHGRVGNKDQAFECLRKAFATTPTELAFTINYEPGFDSLRSDHRFGEILRKLGF
jgi:serine/threonine protein kinase